jgi:hypothetical protein
MSIKFSKRKNFIFHNKEAVAHVESQPNQSQYIENLVIKDYSEQPNEIVDLILKVLNGTKNEIKVDTNFDNSISNILNI